MCARMSLPARRGIWCILCAPVAALLAGCGSDDPKRVVVEGNVTYLGQPIEIGGIQFVPVDETPGVAILVEIADGKYVAAANGGIPVGTYRVEIMGFRRPRAGVGPIPSEAPGERYMPAKYNVKAQLLSEAPREQYLPDKHNVKTQLTTTIEASAAPLTRDFALSE